MARVELARHLLRFFPQLDGAELEVQADTAAQVVAELDRLAPGLGFYLTDERGCLRPHVNVFIGRERIVDRERLSDPVGPESRVHILQALTGG